MGGQLCGLQDVDMHVAMVKRHAASAWVATLGIVRGRVFDAFPNLVRRLGDSSPFSAATLTCTTRCAPASVQRICRFLAMRRLTTCLTAERVAEIGR